MTKQAEAIAMKEWFNPRQIEVINSNSAIRNNISDFVSGIEFGNFSKVNEPKYHLFNHLKDALNYIYSLKIKVGDNFADKINASFYQATIFDKPSGENLIFCNLLLSEGRLKIAIEQIQRNLETPENNIANVSEKPAEYYQFLLYISDVKLKILQENDNSTAKQLNNVFNNFSFRQQIPFQYIEDPKRNIEEQLDGSSKEKGSSEIANGKSFFEQQPNITTGTKIDGINTLGGRNLVKQPNLNFQLPENIKIEAEKLVEALNQGSKPKDCYKNLKGSEIIFPNDNFEPFYLLELERGEDKIYNLLDSSANCISTPNWRIIPHIAEDLKNHLNQIELQTGVNRLRELFYLIQDCKNSQDFLLKIREKNFPKAFLQRTFEVDDSNSRSEKINKFEAWFNKYKIDEKEDKKPLITETVLNETIEIELIEPIVRPEVKQIPSQNFDENQERFYLLETDHNFKVFKKLFENYEALSVLGILLTENRNASFHEKDILSKYVGFGGLKDILLDPEIDNHWDRSNSANRRMIQDIQNAILDIEFMGYEGVSNDVKDSIHNAHYTSDFVINSIYAGIQQLGFKSGKILEPSAGIGNFIGFMPTEMRENSKITQIEIEPITALINTYLYADTKVLNQSLQNSGFGNNSFDLIISNIPFGDYRVFDKNFKGDLAPFQNRIHNYFFAKSINLTREGGIIAFVTSKGVLDANSNKNIREYIAQNSDFLGAIRLPNSTFKNAGTAVVTDIIFLQKTAKKTEYQSIIDNSIQEEILDKDGISIPITINEYFKNNPQNVLGTVKLGGMYSANDFTIVDKEGKLDNLKNQILAILPANIYKESLSETIENEQNSSFLPDFFSDIKIGSIGIFENKIYRKLTPNDFEIVKTKDKLKKVTEYLEIKQNLMELIGLEYNNSNIREVEIQRNILFSLHKSFIAKYGPYEKSLSAIIKIDSDYYNVLALTDSKGNHARILSMPTITPLKQISNTNNIDEAILISLYETNKIDINRMAVLMNSSVENVISSATDKIFYDVNSEQFIHSVEYLSGNVKAKLKEVTLAIEAGNNTLQSNFNALEAVIPKDIPTSLIEARMGSRWIDPQYYQEFIVDLLKTETVKIHYNKSIDEYNLVGKNDNLLTIKQFGTDRISGVDLIQLAMHIQQPIIRDLISRDPDKYQVNRVETARAIEKWTLIREKFEDWLWKTKERREYLGQKYNSIFNTSVKRQYDGSYLNFEGLNGITLNPHQKDADWMLLQNNGGIIDHIVGSGKTFIIVTATMKMKQMGIANKPMVIALKSTVPQIVESYRKAYPFANILAPTESEFKKENRLKLFSKIALNDWDCVIISHDNYGMIPHEADIEKNLIEAELHTIQLEISELHFSDQLSASDLKRMLANMEKREKNLTARLEKISDMSKDDTITFQKMGIDHLMVDESQQFKNLAYTSKIKNVAGMSKQDGSKRSFNLLMACRFLQQKYGGDKGITFLSGTPISNSLVELYLLFKYLRPTKMQELGFDTFDQWATTFANPKTDIEYTITGQFKPKTRFSEFINVPELSMLYTEVADIRNDENLVLDKPKMQTNGYIIKSVGMDEIQRDYGMKIIDFATTKDGSHLGLGELTDGQKTAYMLMATNLANKMSIDMRLINSSYSYNPDGKLGMLVNNVTDIFHNTTNNLGTQLIFSDIGTPKNKESKATLMLDYLQDEMNVDEETIRLIYGEIGTENYKMLNQEKLDEKLKLYLELNDIDLEKHYEVAAESGGVFNLYAEVKFRLEQKGIPSDQIVFIHEYNTSKKKEELFNQVNNGEVRIILGSTQKLGTGVNVQERNVAIHHLDVPWRPSDMEQRNGRGLRQGNKITKEFYNNELPIYTYCTELTLDIYKYQLLHSKDFLIKQVKNGSIDPSMRVVKEMDGDGEGGNGYAHLVAALSGNMDVIEKIKLEARLEQLQKSKKSFEAEKYEAEERINRIANNIPKIEANIEKTEIDLEVVRKMPITDDNRLKFNSIDDELFTERKELGASFVEKVIQTSFGKELNEPFPICLINGIEILGEKSKDFWSSKKETKLSFVLESGQHYSFNFSEIGGVCMNNLEANLLKINGIYITQIKSLSTNQSDLEVYKELLKASWSKEDDLIETRSKLNEILERFSKTENEEEPKLQILPPNHFEKAENKEMEILLKTLKNSFPKTDLFVYDFSGEFANKMNLNTFTTNNGVIYGFQKNSEIYLNQNSLNPNTAIHEYGHLWLQILKTDYPKAYKNIINAMIEDKAMMKIIANDPNYSHLKTSELIANEALAKLIGDSGEIDFMHRNDISHKIKKMIQEFWVNLKKIFGFENKNIRDWSVEEFKEAGLRKVVGVVTGEVLGREFKFKKERILKQPQKYSFLKY